MPVKNIEIASDKKPAAPAQNDAATDTANGDEHRSLAQRRAEHALASIKCLRDEGNYLSFVKALPATIIMSGLGQAMAMEKAGGNKTEGKENDTSKGHKELYSHISMWLLNEGGVGWVSSDYSGKYDILNAIVTGSEQDYLRAQSEALEYLEWLKKFAVAHLVEKS